MMKRSVSKFIGASALSLSLAVCCYGADRGATFPARAAFKPMVARGVDSAIGVNLDKDQAFKVADAFTDWVSKAIKVDNKEVAETKKKIAALKKRSLQRGAGGRAQVSGEKRFARRRISLGRAVAGEL